jgi:hypothetical protein
MGTREKRETRDWRDERDGQSKGSQSVHVTPFPLVSRFTRLLQHPVRPHCTIQSIP